MEKRPAKKIASSKQTKSKSASYFVIHITAISFILLIVVLISVLTFKTITKPTVLGINTSASSLADQGPNGNNPDALNNSDDQQISPPQGNPQQNGRFPHGHLEMQTERNKDGFTRENQGTPIEMQREDNGTMNVHIQKPDDIETQTEGNSLNQMNESLRDRDIEISSMSAHGFLIRSGSIEAQTRFPLSVDPTTHQLTITTPMGVKEVTVLPNQAVQNLLKHQVLSSVKQSSESSSVNSPITLTQVNSQPAFAVQGASDKKLLGIFPVSLDKTVFVSAQTGSVLQTQESTLNKILEVLSF